MGPQHWGRHFHRPPFAGRDPHCVEESGKRRDPLLELVNAVLDEVVTNQSHVAALSDEVHIMSMQENKCRQ